MKKLFLLLLPLLALSLTSCNKDKDEIGSGTSYPFIKPFCGEYQMTCDYTYIDHLNDTETTLTKPVTVTIYTDSDAKYLNLYINDEEINASLTVGGAFKQISPNEITCDYKYVETHNIYQCTLTLRLNGESIVDYTRTSSYPPQNYENRHYLRGHKIN